MLNKRKIFVLWLLAALVSVPGQTVSAADHKPYFSRVSAADKFYRTELYFGMNRADGATVSEEEWNKFLETEVTPRFPRGFTVLEGYGQYKNSEGKIVREASRVLILFYPKKERETLNPKIEELRTAYKKQFAQESVLRLDFRRAVAVSF